MLYDKDMGKCETCKSVEINGHHELCVLKEALDTGADPNDVGANATGSTIGVALRVFTW